MGENVPFEIIDFSSRNSSSFRGVFGNFLRKASISGLICAQYPNVESEVFDIVSHKLQLC